jgi:hypothetical protein
LGITGGAYITSLPTAAAQFSGLGGAIGIGQAAYGLDDPGANAKYAAPTGELGSGAASQGGLYNENAGAAPPGSQGALAANDEWCGGKWTEQGCSYKLRDIVGADLLILPAFGDVARSLQVAWSWAFGSARAAHTIAMTTQQAATVLRTPPQGYRTMAQFGERLGWGSGRNALETALARTQSLTLGEAQGLGISSNQTFLIRDAYRAVLNCSKGMRNGVTINEAALGREVLMHKLGLVLEAVGL